MPSQAEAHGRIISGPNEAFRHYDQSKYHRAISELLSHRRLRLALLLISSLTVGVLYPLGQEILSPLDAVLVALTMLWLIPLALLAVYLWALLSFRHVNFYFDPAFLEEKRGELEAKRILYTIVTRGWNIESLEASARSVLYWTRRVSDTRRLNLRSEIWIVTEEDAYNHFRARYDSIAGPGARILVVPSDYTTKNRTRFKARALQYATEIRRNLGFNTSSDWVYHQDEETQVGEDTIIGNLEFTLSSRPQKTFGAGIILYPRNWWVNIPSAEELARSSLYDFLYLFSMMKGSNSAPGYHGSHFITRADIEDQIGWDFGPRALTEDGIFAAEISASDPMAMGIMKGFAYEQPPLTIRELLKQRRRWITGALSILTRHDIRWREKVPILGGLLVGFSVFPALVGFVLTVLYVTRGGFPGQGFVLGFLAFSMVDVYRSGYVLNKPYLQSPPSNFAAKARLIAACLAGLLLDSLTPWYSLIRPAASYEVTRKASGQQRN